MAASLNILSKKLRETRSMSRAMAARRQTSTIRLSCCMTGPTAARPTMAAPASTQAGASLQAFLTVRSRPGERPKG
jgi:hypothetical protein